MSSEIQKTAVLAPSDREPGPDRAKTARRADRSFTAAWIILCVYCNCVGWVLSALHELNRTGYAVAFLIGIALLVCWQKKTGDPLLSLPRWAKLKNRFCRPLPLAFVVLTVLSTLGGLLHAPNNYDSLTYRLPRILHWLAGERWDWILTDNIRMNYSGTAWEWVAAPWLLFAHSDRLLFLINVMSFCLMPRLLFSVFQQAGVPGRMARLWMWLFPMAFGFAMQSASTGNDLISACFLLAAMDFGMRARKTRRIEEAAMCLLAAALMTGVKASNLPLLLPVTVAVFPALSLFRTRLLSGAGVVLVGALVSFAPMAALNAGFSGSWTGDPKNVGMLQVSDPKAALFGNLYLVGIQTLMPPCLPNAGKLKPKIIGSLPESWQHYLTRNYARFHMADLNEIPQEEISSLGLGVGLLFLLTIGLGAWGLFFSGRGPIWSLPGFLIGGGAWVAFVFFLMKMGSEAVARLALPFYPLLILPFLAAPSLRRHFDRPLFRGLMVLAVGSAFFCVVFTPSRPLFPLSWVEAIARKYFAGSALSERAIGVYKVYASRNDVLRPVRDLVPVEVQEIGYMAGGDMTEYSLWRPFGFRRVMDLSVEHALSGPSPTEWVVMSADVYQRPDITEWIQGQGAEMTGSVQIVLKYKEGGVQWGVFHFPKPARGLNSRPGINELWADAGRGEAGRF